MRAQSRTTERDFSKSEAKTIVMVRVFFGENANVSRGVVRENTAIQLLNLDFDAGF